MDERQRGANGTGAALTARPRDRERWRPLESVIRLLSATIVIGAVAGALIGGVGGRIAMRVLFVTSDDAVKGAISDDGFEIGRFTLGDTVGLVIVTAFIGVIAALFFLAAWPFLARLGHAAVPATAALYGVVGGAMMVHRDGIDFHLLEPVLLAIALFVGICAGFGAAVAHVVGRAARRDAWPQTAPRWLIALPLLALLFPPFLPVALAGVAMCWAEHHAQDDPLWWRVLRAGAYVVMGALFVIGLVDLVRDTAALT
jgi:hypothetical protein